MLEDDSIGDSLVSLVLLLFWLSNIDGVVVDEGVKRLERGVCCEVFALESVGRDGTTSEVIESEVIESDANGSVLASFIVDETEKTKMQKNKK